MSVLTVSILIYQSVKCGLKHSQSGQDFKGFWSTAKPVVAGVTPAFTDAQLLTAFLSAGSNGRRVNSRNELASDRCANKAGVWVLCLSPIQPEKNL